MYEVYKFSSSGCLKSYFCLFSVYYQVGTYQELWEKDKEYQ